MKKHAAMLLSAAMVMGMTTGVMAEGISYSQADLWMYENLNPHYDYQGWQEYGYGNIEMLYVITDDGALTPWLAKDAEVSEDGKEWTITLNDAVHFSDGTALTAEQVIMNLQDLGEVNGRYPYLQTAQMEAVDDLTVKVTLADPYFTFINDLSDPDAGIVKMGDDQDIENAPIGTGPFIVTDWQPMVSVDVVKNDNYWDGEAKIDTAHIAYVPDQDTQFLAMQNGEIDTLYSPSATAIEVFSADPENYDIVYASTSRLYYYYLNCETMSANVRKAVNMAMNQDEYVIMMNGLLEPAQGPFLPSAAFGKCEKKGYSVEGAKAALEEDGYTLNGDGFYEKDGSELVLNICYYPARSLDKFAALLQEQLKKAGIKAQVASYEDPDAGYITNGNYDIGFYNSITCPAGDPYYHLNTTFGDGSYGVWGYDKPEVKDLLTQLSVEPDIAKRADLANQIVQNVVDDDACGYIGYVVKATILKKGCANIGESNPYHGGLNVNSVVE